MSRLLTDFASGSYIPLYIKLEYTTVIVLPPSAINSIKKHDMVNERKNAKVLLS